VKRLLAALLLVVVGLAALGGRAYFAERRFVRDHPGPGRFVTVGGARVHYVDRIGGEPAVLMLHGNPGTALDFLRVMDRMAPEHRTLAIDRPGYGWSERPGDRMSPFDQARIVRGVVRALGIARPVLVGFSFGGAVALAYAEEFPSDLSALILLAAVADPVAGHRMGRAQALLAVRGAGFAMAYGVAPFLAPGVIEEGFVDAFAPRPVEREVVERGRWLFSRPATLRASAWDWAELEASFPRLDRGYPGIRVPVEAVSSAGDRIVGPSHARRIADRVPGAHLVTLADAGHQIPYTHADDVAAAIRRAIARSHEPRPLR